jgi:catechol 2,3-dioxygenase-like lactoylglutathione lyase family enzyme
MTEPTQMVNVRYMVDDVETSIDFYTRQFGVELRTSAAPAFADITRDGRRLLLSGQGSFAGRPMPDGVKPGPGGWSRIHLIVDNLAAKWTASARPRAGAAVLAEPRPGVEGATMVEWVPPPARGDEHDHLHRGDDRAAGSSGRQSGGADGRAARGV